MEQTLGKRIVYHRKKLNLTQDQLAERLGVTAQAVSKWENDQSCPDISMLPKLSDIFGISTDELLGREAPPPVHTAEVVQDEDADDSGLKISFNTDKEEGKWVFHWDSGRKKAVLFAVCVLMVGVLYLLSKINQWDVSFWNILWPTVLLVYGIEGIFPQFSVFHLAMTLFGGCSLVTNLGFWQLSIGKELIFPICVVLFGIGLLVDALKKPKKPKFSVIKKGSNTGNSTWDYCSNGDDTFVCSLSFGENTHVVELPLLREGDIDVSFGELTLDLSGCGEIVDHCEIDANCSFGQLNLLVPQKYLVKTDSSTAFAACSVKGQPSASPEGVIHLDASVSFGEILVKYI